MSFRNNRNTPVKVAVPATAQSHNSKVFENPQMQKIIKTMQEEISTAYEDLSNKYKVFNSKHSVIVDEIVRFDASIGEADTTLKSIMKIQEALSASISAITNGKSKEDIQNNLDLLLKLRSKQSEKELDVMPSISIFKTYIENINKLIIDAQVYVTSTFSNNEKERSELLNSLILCADKFSKKCAEAKLLADVRTRLRAKQEAFDEIEIPRCRAMVTIETPSSMQTSKKDQATVRQSSTSLSGSKPNLFSPSTGQMSAKNDVSPKQKMKAETNKIKSIFSATNSDSTILKSNAVDKSCLLQAGKK